MAIIAVVSGASLSLVLLERANRFDSQVETMLAELRLVQSQAKVVTDNKEYGMSFTANSWTTFSRDPASGNQTSLQTRQLSSLTLTTALNPAASQIVFERLTGKTQNATSGTLTLTRTNPARTKTIRIESTGVFYVQ